jgi:L-phenylalanine/L-methionine N-acetyltransferase
MTISVRAAEPGDYVAVQKIFAGPKVIWGTLQLPFPSEDMWRERCANTPEGTVRLVACMEHDVVGQIDIRSFLNHPRRRHVGRIGMAVRDDCQGRGVGSALLQAVINLADQWLNLQRLELEVYTDHEPALRLYQRFGFVIEGTLARFAYREGQYVDAYAMARLKPG